MPPDTIWSPTDGNSEYTSPGTSDIVDTTGAFLVDTVGNNIVDTGTDLQLIPDTIWAEDDSQ